jgi:hypothetical protein
MGFLPLGGFVFSIDRGNYVGTERAVNDETFKEIAKILKIPDKDIAQLIAHKPRSVYVYRGTPKKEAPFDTVAGGGGDYGSGSGGSGSGGGGNAS